MNLVSDEIRLALWCSSLGRVFVSHAAKLWVRVQQHK